MEFERAKATYENRLKRILERDHPGRLVSIEPESGDYFIGDDVLEVLMAARGRHPTRQCAILRIGGGGAVRVGSPRI